jgi:glucosamine 6-phosphate synthetase-like amidotransferase/phosphosugar isomerase protein
VALIHSEGINAGEMKHGPLALVDENLPILVVSAARRPLAAPAQQPPIAPLRCQPAPAPP